MKGILTLLTVCFLVVGITACNDDEKMPTGNITTADALLLPRDNYSVSISSGNSVVFEWEPSSAADDGYIVYQLLFDKEGRDFSSPVYILTSDDNGYSPTATVTATTLNTVASMAGAGANETISLQWSVRAYCGMVYSDYGGDNGVRTITITRPNSVDPLPSWVELSGSASKDGTVTLVDAIPVATSAGTISSVSRTTGCFEGWFELGAGDLQIIDDEDRYFTLNNGVLNYSTDEESVTSITDAGIYYLYLNFNTMTYTLSEIESVVVWIHPWFGSEDTEPLEYEGNGVWAVTDWAWDVGNSSQFDSRHKFICTFEDGSYEYWGHYDDDCREHSNPESSKNDYFYNIFRLSSDIGDWDHCWKTCEDDREGYDQLATFRVHMNNEEELFYYERSFKDKGEGGETGGDAGGDTGGDTGGDAGDESGLVMGGLGSEDGQAFKANGDNYEIYTQLIADSPYYFYDSAKSTYYWNDGGTLTLSSSAPSGATVSETAPYLITVDFSANTVTVKQISSCVIRMEWTWSYYTELNYQGVGVWKKEGYECLPSDGGDERYKIRFYFTDDSEEAWGQVSVNYYDYRPSITDDNPSGYWNMERQNTNQWAGNEFKYASEIYRSSSPYITADLTVYMTADNDYYYHEFSNIQE